MKYRIVMTETADEQMRDILFYIADDSGSIDAALNYLSHLEKTVKQLEDFPYIGIVPKYTILRRQGYRILIVKKHLVFYKVDEIAHEVIIYAVIDSRREYERLLR